MLTSLVRFCVKEAPLVVLLTIGLVVFGWYSYQTVAIDAIPNIGENQVIVLTPWPGRSPKDIEDQVTYPLSVSLSAVPGAESVRGKSMFGYSFVQVTFKDSVDFYWDQSRVSEQLGSGAAQLPDGVTPQLGPDATGLGQVFYYVLIPPKEGKSLADLRSLQDFVVKYELQAVEGVSEVASIGGYVRQYQIEVDPDKLRFHNVTLDKLVMAVKGSNVDVGAKTIESSGMEFIVRGKGFLGTDGDTTKAIRDTEETVIEQREGVPLRIKDVAHIQLGPDFRRGALDYNGGEAVGGVVVMRYGENPRAVIDRVKARIEQVTPSLDGVTIQVVETALGGMNLINTVEGRERYPVRLRYRRDMRERIDQLGQLPVVTPTGQVVPLEELASLETTWGPGAINSENARLVAHVAFASNGRVGDRESMAAIEKSLREAQALPESDPNRVTLPPGYSLEAVGSFRNQIEANQRLIVLVPLVILINLLIIYLQFRHWPITLAVFAGIPVAFGGGMIMLALYGTEMNTAIWIGFIALFGIAVDDGVVIATYIDQVFSRLELTSIEDIRVATIEAGKRRIRPCLMTTATTVLALLPVLTSTGRGADVARAMAIPVFGGMIVELVTLFVVPVVFCGYKEFKMNMGWADRHWEGIESIEPNRDV